MKLDIMKRRKKKKLKFYGILQRTLFSFEQRTIQVFNIHIPPLSLSCLQHGKESRFFLFKSNSIETFFFLAYNYAIRSF